MVSGVLINDTTSVRMLPILACLIMPMIIVWLHICYSLIQDTEYS